VYYQKNKNKKGVKMKFLIYYLFIFISLLYSNEEIKYNNYRIEINVINCNMYFYGIIDGEEKLIKTYKVATPKITENFPKEQGKILKVDLNPWWYPTERTKEEFKKRDIYLPNAVPPGDKNNYMGDFKIHLSMCTKDKGCVYRIHGNLDENSIGKRTSGGCIRMHNIEGKEFAIQIKNILEEGKEVLIQYT